jgi:AmiR/NasT family two-component response regulator
METATALVIKEQGSRSAVARARNFLQRAGFRTATLDSGAPWPADTATASPDFVLLESRGGARLIGEVKRIHRKIPKACLLVVIDALNAGAASKAYTAGATAVVPRTAAEHAVRNLIETLQRGVITRRSTKPKSRTKARVIALKDAFVERFHDPGSGRLDASRVAEAYGVSLSALARSLKVTQSALSKRPTAAAAQAGLRELEFVWATLMEVLTTEARAKAWLRSSRRDLDDQPPISLLTGGSAQALANYMRSVLAGEPG